MLREEKQRRIKDYVAFVPALIMVAVIFVFSSQDGVLSKETSGNLTKWILAFLGRSAGAAEEAVVREVEAADVLVRMVVHMAEYAVLSLFIGFAVTMNGVRGKLRFIYMMLLGIIVSLTDEFYQIFVPGRYGDLADVIFDSLGIAAVALLWYFAGLLWKKKSEEDTIMTGRRKFMNVSVDNLSFLEAVEHIGELAKTGKGSYVVTPNVDHIIKIEKDAEFREIYKDADLILTDGTPLMWIAESMGNPIREKITGADMFPKICEYAAKKGYSIFLLGAAEGVAEKAVENLRKRYAKLKVAGTYSPRLRFEENPEEIKKIFSIINEKKPDILVLALGSPKQEKFIYKYRHLLEFHVALCFGAAVDFEAGEVKRAPAWIRKIGMEWFYRFLCEPGRLFKRYFVDDMKIFWLAWKYRYDLQKKEKLSSK